MPSSTPMEAETRSFPATCLALPFEAGLETGFVLTFFGGGSASISSCAFVGGAFFDNADVDEAVVDVMQLVSRVELRVARVEEASESGAGSLARFRFGGI